jgi:small subunit ribosomal protein S12
MATFMQSAKNNGRCRKRRRSLVAALFGGPQRRGVVVKLAITTPRKPNSAKRKYAKMRIIYQKKQRRVRLIHAHIPGTGPHYLQEYHVALIEGGSPPDTPGVNYSLIRGPYDFNMREIIGRKKRRSKFGTKGFYL